MIIHRFAATAFYRIRGPHDHLVNRDLARLLDRCHGAVLLDDALTVVPRHVIKYALARGHVVSLLPAVYVHADLTADVEVRERAALLYAGSDAVLTHHSALRRWGLPVPAEMTQLVHVTVPMHVRRRTRPAVVNVHRTTRRVPTRSRGGMEITRLERSIVDSWPLLTGADQRAPAIVRSPSDSRRRSGFFPKRWRRAM